MGERLGEEGPHRTSNTVKNDWFCEGVWGGKLGMGQELLLGGGSRGKMTRRIYSTHTHKHKCAHTHKAYCFVFFVA